MSAARDYYGAPLGPLSQLHHAVSGDVYAVDSRTLFIKNFNYDGEGPGKSLIRLIELSINKFIVCLMLSKLAVESIGIGRYMEN